MLNFLVCEFYLSKHTKNTLSTTYIVIKFSQLIKIAIYTSKGIYYREELKYLEGVE